MLAPRRSIVISAGKIDQVSCPFEEFISRFFKEVFPWMGEFRLEEKSQPIFKEQFNFESAIQTRLYRLWKNGYPTKCCVRFTYDTANKDYMASWRKESRDYMIEASKTINIIRPVTELLKEVQR